MTKLTHPQIMRMQCSMLKDGEADFQTLISMAMQSECDATPCSRASSTGVTLNDKGLNTFATWQKEQSGRIPEEKIGAAQGRGQKWPGSPTGE